MVRNGVPRQSWKKLSGSRLQSSSRSPDLQPSRFKPSAPRHFSGIGKIDELGRRISDGDAAVVIVNAPLTAVQQRNLERMWKAKVVDRTGLILEIFGERAHTKEGSLQVELAHLQYQKSRLVRSWTHLERQRGGFGFLGGPGKSQLEIDRRLIQERIKRIADELQSVKRTRGLHRKSRARVPYPIVAIVGYTNAGKSSLFNRLTGSGVYAEDLLFATLDPTMREVRLPHGRRIILSDTVGFISDLPTMLVAAFRATLEEVIAADLILHIRDVSHEDTHAQAEDVAKVLKDLDIDEARRRWDVLEVWNKIDRVTELRQRRELSGKAARLSHAVLVSALTGEGIERSPGGHRKPARRAIARVRGSPDRCGRFRAQLAVRERGSLAVQNV